MQTIPFKNPVCLLDFCAHRGNEHSPKIPHVLEELTEMVRQDQEQTPMFLSSFAVQIKLDQQIVSLKNMFLLSPYLYIMGLANQPIKNQLSYLPNVQSCRVHCSIMDLYGCERQ